MLKKVLIGIAGLVAVFLGVVAVQPAEYRVERSAHIQAPPDVIWAEVADFNRWKEWSPWEKADPEQKITVTGQPGTVGHKTMWEGEKTGKGSMTVVEAAKPTRLAMGLDFLEPYPSQAGSAFELETQPNGVKVTWSMDGKNDFMGKAFGLMMNMDEMVGSMYEKGLNDLKVLAEASAKKQAEAAMAAAAQPAEGQAEADPAK